MTTTTGFSSRSDGIAQIDKAPAAVLDYTELWTNWLTAGETIQSVAWTVPVGLTQQSITNDTTTATIWLSGGTAGTSYLVICTITTNQGRSDTRSFRVRVTPR